MSHNYPNGRSHRPVQPLSCPPEASSRKDGDKFCPNEKPAQTAQTVLACIKPYEYERFLKPNVEAGDLGFNLEIMDSAEGRDAMIAKLEDLNAEILMSDWSTPPLPEDLLDRAGSLKYLCHLCGTVRRKVPRVLIERGLIVTGWGNPIAHVVAECSLLQILGALRLRDLDLFAERARPVAGRVRRSPR